MDLTILDIIEYYLKTSEETYFVQLLERFQPLVRKYAKKLYYLEYDDSIQELNLAIYEALQKMTYTTNEFACISYLKTAIYHKFCKLYANSEYEQKKNETEFPFEDLILSSEETSIKDCIFLLDLCNQLDSVGETKKKNIVFASSRIL